MSRAGQANEAGSVARRNAGTYLAVHMLAGRSVEALENYKTIEHIAFETTDPTDDIVVTFADQSRAFASVKRRVTQGTPFIETVTGWVEQLRTGLADGDLLVLICEEAAGWIGHLSDALAKIRVGVGSHSARELSALARLDDLVPPQAREDIRHRARILELPRSATNRDGRTVLALMMNELVENGAGAKALGVVAELVHDWAGAASGFNADRLVAAMASRDVAVKADEHGPSAAKAAAAQAASSAYLAALAAPMGRIDLTLLADDLTPIVIDDLLGNVRVSVAALSSAERDPRALLRRNRRMLIVGQPGSGKSVTLREIAAWCATSPDAPIPLPVHLPDLLPRHADHAVTVSDLVTLAARRGPRASTSLVEGVLARAVAEGDAIFLLDGLDECHGKAAWMASQLRTLVAALPPTSAVVVATRASAEVPATSIGLPRVDLHRPGDLDATIDAVLTQCAQARVPDPEARAAWLKARRNWLKSDDARQNGMLQVPQLALLVALILGSTAEAHVPHRRAELLHEAVLQSVQRWEHERFTGSVRGTWARELSPAMLLDGFVVLGRLLDGRDTAPTRTEAVEALSDILTNSDRWGLPGAQARELAGQALAFWDTHVSVFVLDEEGHLTSRSRVFTEVATAMWTNSCSPAELHEWAIDAIRYHDSEGVITLALGLNSDVVGLLLDLGESSAEAALAVAANVRSTAVELNNADFARLVDQLGKHALRIQSGAEELPERLTREDNRFARLFASRRGGGPTSWPLIESLYALQLDEPLRARRDAVMAELVPFGLQPPAVAIAKSWAAFLDAVVDQRPLTEAEIAHVAAALGHDLPRMDDMVEVDGTPIFNSWVRSHPGLGFVARNAIPVLDRLPPGSARKIYDISQWTSHREGSDIKNALERAGVDTSVWEEPNRFADMLPFHRERAYEKELLGDIAHLGDTSTTLAKHHRWSLGELAKLLEATSYSNVAVGDFRAALEHDDSDLRRRWLAALGVAYSIDMDLAAAQAALVRAQAVDDLGITPGWWVITARGLTAPEPTSSFSLDAGEQESLLAAMHAASHWLAFSALYVLANTRHTTWDPVEFYNVDRHDWPPYRASECYLLSLLVSADGPDLARRAAESSESARRQALHDALHYRPALDPTGELKARLRTDEDLWVRGRYDGTESSMTYWTCRWCGERNLPHHGSCKKCELASRPSIGL